MSESFKWQFLLLDIVEVSEPTSFRDARRRVKAFNADRRLHASEWAIVVASDGRKGGAV